MTGWRNDVRPWMAAADLLLSTSEYESFGYMVAEALAMERPVVATDVTGTCDIMSAELAPFLFPPGDTTRAAELIGGLLRSPGLSERCGRIGREKDAERFGSSAMRNSLDALYSQLAPLMPGVQRQPHLSSISCEGEKRLFIARLCRPELINYRLSSH